MKKYRSEKSGQAILETYDRILSSWQCETKERDIEGEYGTTHVIECGTEEGPALVLFHGVGDDSALMWIYNAPELGKHFHLYAIDTMGGPGKSDSHCRPSCRTRCCGCPHARRSVSRHAGPVADSASRGGPAGCGGKMLRCRPSCRHIRGHPSGVRCCAGSG